MKPLNDKIFDAVTVTTTSDEFKADYQVACSVQVVATGTIAGTVKIQFSNDPMNGPPIEFERIR